ncbi:6-phosphogluconolactonase [Candidatus Protochlamydia sp. W-9]|uniref:6-phosphogluconolactonase n=1 Tax=Candidatus Protochlamydia sp. W-9 TaxID=1785087 RepID=UPI00096A6AF3|nr:6-phosphogluconolactonase [Candidatus Protochlamydia sp. W-9]
MQTAHWKTSIRSFDERRDFIVVGNAEETIQFCVKQFIEIAQEAIEKRGLFTVALSGGQTPNAIFKKLSQQDYLKQLDWTKVFCFWSDERNVPPTDTESNYAMAMESGLAKLPLKREHIFRMKAESDIEENALKYEAIIREKVSSNSFDLLMLGMGDDGHTASLFPHTQGLHAKDRLVIANYVPQKHTWRMSLTYECIHLAKTICIYAMGKKKTNMVAQALTKSYDPDNLPIQRIGTTHHKALWILDHEAGEKLLQIFQRR